MPICPKFLTVLSRIVAVISCSIQFDVVSLFVHCFVESEDAGESTDQQESDADGGIRAEKASTDEDGGSTEGEDEEEDEEAEEEPPDNPDPALITLEGVLQLGGVSLKEYESWKAVEGKAPLELTACLLQCMTGDKYATALVLCQRGEHGLAAHDASLTTHTSHDITTCTNSTSTGPFFLVDTSRDLEYH